MKKPGRPLGGYRVQAAYWLAAKILFQRNAITYSPFRASTREAQASARSGIGHAALKWMRP
jgi:hypothetical protein